MTTPFGSLLRVLVVRAIAVANQLMAPLAWPSTATRSSGCHLESRFRCGARGARA